MLESRKESPVRFPQADDNDSSSCGSPKKRGRPDSSWVLDVAEGSTKRTHYMPATKAQQQDTRYIYDSMTRSREPRPIAAQGLYPHPLLGLSVPQVTVRSPELTEGRTEGSEGLYIIPRTLSERQRLMLQTTEDEVEHGAVRVIKCKLCPAVALKSWQCFRRHCNTCEDLAPRRTHLLRSVRGLFRTPRLRKAAQSGKVSRGMLCDATRPGRAKEDGGQAALRGL
jgi:hypothetical protein